MFSHQFDHERVRPAPIPETHMVYSTAVKFNLAAGTGCTSMFFQLWSYRRSSGKVSAESNEATSLNAPPLLLRGTRGNAAGGEKN